MQNNDANDDNDDDSINNDYMTVFHDTYWPTASTDRNVRPSGFKNTYILIYHNKYSQP